MQSSEGVGLMRTASSGRQQAWTALREPVEEDDGEGGKRRRNRGRKQRKGTPQGAPISPLEQSLHEALQLEGAGAKPMGVVQRMRAGTYRIGVRDA